ncbi:hypothetical protein JCM6882_007438 [Rhodosporidiobolus microsporus]
MSTPAPPAPSAPAPPPSLLASTSTHERVLLAQAAFAKGNEDFAAVAEALRGHALLRAREGGWFEAENLKRIYEEMVTQLGMDASLPRPAQSPELRKIAHKYYMDRVYELHAGMQECQDQFRIIYSELSELKEGKLDWRLTEPGRVVPPGSSPVRRDAAPLAGADVAAGMGMEGVEVGQ